MGKALLTGRCYPSAIVVSESDEAKRANPSSGWNTDHAEEPRSLWRPCGLYRRQIIHLPAGALGGINESIVSVSTRHGLTEYYFAVAIGRSKFTINKPRSKIGLLPTSYRYMISESLADSDSEPAGRESMVES